LPVGTRCAGRRARTAGCSGTLLSRRHLQKALESYPGYRGPTTKAAAIWRWQRRRPDLGQSSRRRWVRVSSGFPRSAACTTDTRARRRDLARLTSSRSAPLSGEVYLPSGKAPAFPFRQTSRQRFGSISPGNGMPMLVIPAVRLWRIEFAAGTGDRCAMVLRRRAETIL